MNEKFHPGLCDEARRLYLAGFTDEDVARHFKIDRATIYRWRKTHPEFDEAVKFGKYVADTEIVSTFFKLATGYTQEEERLVTYQGESKIEKINVYYPPQKELVMHWLGRRVPLHWGEYHERVQIKNGYRVEPEDKFENPEPPVEKVPYIKPKVLNHPYRNCKFTPADGYPEPPRTEFYDMPNSKRPAWARPADYKEDNNKQVVAKNNPPQYQPRETLTRQQRRALERQQQKEKEKAEKLKRKGENAGG